MPRRCRRRKMKPKPLCIGENSKTVGAETQNTVEVEPEKSTAGCGDYTELPQASCQSNVEGECMHIKPLGVGEDSKSASTGETQISRVSSKPYKTSLGINFICIICMKQMTQVGLKKTKKAPIYTRCQIETVQEKVDAGIHHCCMCLRDHVTFDCLPLISNQEVIENMRNITCELFHREGKKFELDVTDILKAVGETRKLNEAYVNKFNIALAALDTLFIVSHEAFNYVNIFIKYTQGIGQGDKNVINKAKCYHKPLKNIIDSFSQRSHCFDPLDDEMVDFICSIFFIREDMGNGNEFFHLVYDFFLDSTIAFLSLRTGLNIFFNNFRHLVRSKKFILKAVSAGSFAFYLKEDLKKLEKIVTYIYYQFVPLTHELSKVT